MQLVKNILGITLTLGLTAPVLAGDDEEEDEGPGVPHIVAFNDGGAVGLEFELVPVEIIDGIPTVTIFLPNYNALADEFTSNPVGGLADGFLNDDNGFESEDLPAGSNLVVTLTQVLSDDSDGFFLSLGTEFIEVVNDSFSLGDEFDDHPIFALTSADENFIGSASLIFEVADSNNQLTGVETFGVILTTDPALALVPEPGSAAALLLGAGLIAARRRRK